MKRVALYAAAVLAIAILASLGLPRRSHGVVATAVQVVNSAPLAVNTDSPAKAPVTFFLDYYPGEPSGTYQVPAGQQLVVETVTGYCSPETYSTTPLAFQPVLNIAPAGFNAVSFFLLPTFLGPAQYAVSQPLRVYGAPGATVSLSTYSAATTPSRIDCFANISGYLTAAP
jgi:hypothetical protein